MMEEWKEIPGYEGLYECSNFGKVRTCPIHITTECGYYVFSDREEVNQFQRGKYLDVYLVKGPEIKMHRVHKLVLWTFVGFPPDNKPHGRHLDDQKNNNRLDNLAWGSAQENVQDAIRNGVFQMGSRHRCSQMTEETAQEILDKFQTGNFKQSQLARDYGVSRHAIYKLIHRKSYKNLPVKTTEN